jgi:diguanylate cyclase (GGDEF)-like protein/PAS domain S-box-containing protein
MSGEKILIVEDERIIAIDLQRRLEKFGYTVLGIVATGEQAVLKAQETLPDIILMDIMLSGKVDGIEAATIIKNTLQIPIIFLTAFSDEKTLERAKQAEPFGYILKPFKEKELYTTIDIALYKYGVDKKLKKQEHWLSAILNSIEDGIIATDTQGLIQFMNPKSEAITGYSEEAAKNVPLEKVLVFSEGKDKPPIPFVISDNSGRPTTPFIFKNTAIENINGDLIPVEGSVALIIDRDGKRDGQVIAIRDISEMKRMSETISYQASHDTLTGLANREEFSERLNMLIDSIRKVPGRQHALIYLDLDQFKIINDTCGHAAGDQLLIQTTSIIKTLIRNSDTCGRLGSDEFGILLENSTLEQALFIANRIHKTLKENKLLWESRNYTITSSIGLVMISDQDSSIHSILAAADDACNIAKDEGGNRIKVYDTSENLFAKRRGEMEWISRITKALEEDRFRLYFQPIVPLAAGKGYKAKCELLIRMVDEGNNIIPPSDFIASAERYNLMGALDRWVIRSSIQAYKWMEETLDSKKKYDIFSINLSATSLADDNIFTYIMSQFSEYGVAPASFCFEITETAAIGNITKAMNFIHKLKDAGSTFALDDFGSGFSSFSYLKSMPVDYLKIDGLFVRDMHESTVNSAMVEAINSLGHVMGKKTIAEFVRNKEILNKLKQIGVDYAQGYEIATPEPIEKIIL